MAYAPAGNTTLGLQHLQSEAIRRKALSRLQKKFKFREVCVEDQLGLREGRTAVWFRYANLAAGTTPSTEGSVGTSLTMTSTKVAATVSEFTNFITVSTLREETAPDPQLEAAGALLGYRGGFSVDTIMRNVIDAESSSTDQTPIATYLHINDIRAAVHGLQAVDVEPFENDEFRTITSPYNSYDLVSDPAANGLADIFKYTAPNKANLVSRDDRGVVTHAAGSKIVESTNVYSSTVPNKWRTYVVGAGAIGCLTLAGAAPAKVMDPSKERFNVRVVKGGTPSIPDPEGVIGGAVSYRFCFTGLVLDGPTGIGGTYRYVTIDAQSSIA